jgi:class 3 adenylate cyclase/alpha-beta hydrolase superfamily lysophospholipase
VLEAPEIRYARNGGYSLAYQLVGAGTVDVVEVPGLLNHLEIMWEEPGLVRFLEEVTRFARVILYDQRGTGLSDRWGPGHPPTPEERVDDLRAVLDAAESERAVVLGVADGGPVAMRFALAHPGRTRALALFNAACCGMRRPGYEQGMTEEFAERVIADVAREWGRGVLSPMYGDGSEEDRRAFARRERRSCTPAVATALVRAYAETDLRDALPLVRVPTLVAHDVANPIFTIEAGRYIADHVPDARLVELRRANRTVRERPGLADAIEEFVMGTVSSSDTSRALAAVLFTDIAGSTERAAALGDQRWRDLLDDHDRRVQHAVDGHLGRVVKTMGDGVLARFDGAGRAVRCAQAIVAEARRLGLDVRAGVHLGDCELRGEDLAGMTVHVAARVAALAAGGEVLVTAAVRDALVGTGVRFDERGRHALRGVPGEWTVLAVAHSARA